jgi:hypothetical protein
MAGCVLEFESRDRNLPLEVQRNLHWKTCHAHYRNIKRFLYLILKHGYTLFRLHLINEKQVK